MAAVFQAIAAQLNSAVFVLIVLLIAVIWLAFKIGGWIGDYNSKKEDFHSLKTSWDRDIPDIKVKVNLLYQRMTDASAVRSTSPLKLTETGNKISDAIDAAGLLAKYKKELKPPVESQSPQHAYDIQQACLTVVENDLPKIMDPDELSKAKDQAVKYGLLLGNVLAVVAVLLRDDILKEKGMSLEDVDVNDPNASS